jgi:hypothetical protein
MKKVQRRQEDKYKRYNVVRKINIKGTTSSGSATWQTGAK